MKTLSDLILSDRTEEKIHQLYFGNEYKKFIRKFKRDKIVTLVVGISLSIIGFLLISVYEKNQLSIPVSEIERNEYGMGDRTMTFQIEGDGKSKYTGKKTIVVREKEYTEEELEIYSEELDEVLWQKILGGNESADCVTGDLNLVSNIDGFPFSISWKSDNPLILSSKGILNSEKLSERLENIYEDTDETVDSEGLNICLTATVSYETFREEKTGYVRVCLLQTEDSFEKELDESIEKYDTKTRNSDKQILPKEVNGVRINFYNVSDHKGVAVLLMGVLSAVLIVLSKDKKIGERAARRQEEMRRDFPGILNKFALYHTAGMNPRSIWNLMSELYEKSSVKKKRYVYEEMVITNRSMKEGRGELSAYEDFAKRCGLPEYRVFINLLQQAVSKGREDFDRVLYEEMEKAGRQETLRVRLMGEEAGTKLLIPMFMMLMIVLVIVMVPAFISFES